MLKRRRTKNYLKAPDKEARMQMRQQMICGPSFAGQLMSGSSSNSYQSKESSLGTAPQGRVFATKGPRLIMSGYKRTDKRLGYAQYVRCYAGCTTIARHE